MSDSKIKHGNPKDANAKTYYDVYNTETGRLKNNKPLKEEGKPIAQKSRNFKISKKFVLAILTAVIVVVGAFYFINIPINQKLTELECGTTYAVSDVVDNRGARNVKISVPKYGKEITFNELGSYKITVEAKKGSRIKKHRIEVTVIDTTPPTIECPDTIIVHQFSEVTELTRQCTVYDIADKTLSSTNIKVSDDYDTFDLGEHSTKISVEDASGNIAEKTINVEVIANAGVILAKDAKNHIGETCTVIGKLYDLSYRPDVNGGPTFINLDDFYPAYNGMQAVVWESNRTSEMISILDEMKSAEYVQITGNIKLYRGIPEIIVYSPSKIKIYKR